VRAGDRIIAIDGTDTTGMSADDAVTRIRGKKGTQVKLMLYRADFKEPKEFVITRGTIVSQAVKWEVKKGKDGKNVGVITITHFNDQVDEKFNEAVRGIVAGGAQSVILDLRNNPGGYLDTAVTVAGEWIHEDTVVEERSSDGKSNKLKSSGISRLAGLPTVVLINGGSASASEIVSGALKDAKEAVLVGEKSFGKGSVQDYTPLGDGSALKLTVALWYTPSGVNINKEGIQPDVTVKLTTDDFNADKDPQMDKAVELLATPGGMPSAEALRRADEVKRAEEAKKEAAKKPSDKN
jgi:carboxyl-terminal processing protease